jgi:hypothetical protein
MHVDEPGQYRALANIDEPRLWPTDGADLLSTQQAQDLVAFDSDPFRIEHRSWMHRHHPAANDDGVRRPVG